MIKVGNLDVWIGSVMDITYQHVTVEDDGEWTTTYRLTYIVSAVTGNLKLIDQNHVTVPPFVFAEVDKHADKLKTIFLLGRK